MATEAKLDVAQAVCEYGNGLLEAVAAIPGITVAEKVLVLEFVIDLCEREIHGMKAEMLGAHIQGHLNAAREN